MGIIDFFLQGQLKLEIFLRYIRIFEVQEGIYALLRWGPLPKHVQVGLQSV
jgi:hypothetical protein